MPPALCGHVRFYLLVVSDIWLGLVHMPLAWCGPVRFYLLFVSDIWFGLVCVFGLPSLFFTFCQMPLALCGHMRFYLLLVSDHLVWFGACFHVG